FFFFVMDKAAQRIWTAIKNKEKILIFGDFDADGVTSTALLSSFFDYINTDVSWYIPHRIEEGYSLQTDHIPMAVELDVDLIITVDCGIGSNDAVDQAKDEDIDVIITDHHESIDELPDAVAIINPKQPGCPSGLNYLAGVGVAFFLVMALRKFFRDKGLWEEIREPKLIDYLDLFTIGTIGDMVPLINENRVLSMAGLSQMKKGSRPGIKSLADISRVDFKNMDSDDISFRIVPRINAAGRISHARICVSQLTGTDVAATEKTAELLDELNLKRQQIEQRIVAAIEKRLSDEPELLEKKSLVLWDDNWNPSVLGIAASKLSKKHHCPVILLSTGNEHAMGSGRSVNNINIHKALIETSFLLDKFGGHAMASGLTLKKENLEQFSHIFNQYIEKTYSKEDFLKTLTIDAVLDLEEITFDLAKQVDKLRPFGIQNPEPIFVCEDARVISSFIIGTNHRKMILEKAASISGHKVEAFHFNLDNPDDEPEYFPKLAFKLKINKYTMNSAQIIIEDIL
ncbi:MAG: single-stranded-DNA-specific exonuclease RecJ, partial [Desulfobacteraceae bacterium]|nr:single-stranded-DNA-specific exonuclease RecJ [Desulfobacteraceae bacterium]